MKKIYLMLIILGILMMLSANFFCLRSVKEIHQTTMELLNEGIYENPPLNSIKIIDFIETFRLICIIIGFCIVVISIFEDIIIMPERKKIE